MLCDICKKNEAVLHIQEVSSEGKKVINLCNECAEKHSQNDPLLKLSGLNFFDVIEDIKKIGENAVKQKKQSTLKCPKCGWSFKEMDENNGLLGCDKCYETFGCVVESALKYVHRSRIHTGKRPHNSKNDPPELRLEKLRKLENELQNAVAAEEYERAAVLRDEIAVLKKKRKKESK